MSGPQHVPVLLEEVLDLLQVRRGGTYADATLGLAGHSSAIARRLGPEGLLIGFDRDPQAMELATAKLEALREELGPEMPQVRLIPRAFSSAAEELEPASLDGLLADFGVSSMQLDQAHRGFSFRQDAPLDMRMDTRSGETAEQVVNQADEEELANLIYEFGEERRSRRIARAIVRARPIRTTAELARVISAAAPAMKQDKIHPATKTFQALRIRVNDELGEIRSLLESAPSLLKFGGRLAVISFHSLEDRLAKDALKEGGERGIWNVITRKPVIAAELEVDRNPRSRSAKLRVAERIKAGPKVTRKIPPVGGSSRGNRTGVS
ncbi:16S rRNA (cytosine(1402)-N(4))-methyltransferase RsmH [Terriglobus roseus]|uniref:Ribosomal RNA small subunit methyltransferase H n=1 Tax=Terriglobus roseus TaxID=392734 RepID=A0A1H4RG36_9BACT|nr:16S rRNA (cytosine(1402)-N(4))-methyltransferase RsmH [Terriglobus roseus]SEC30778.1 16S rRNA (cytosine1402-N4)-methyltransferase [Terriglobus roseus]